MSDLRRDVREWVAYLDEMGVRELSVPRESPTRRTPAKTAPKPAPAMKGKKAPQKPLLEAGASDLSGSPHPDAASRLETIREELGDCTRCKLHGGRTNIVFGVGNAAARLMFVGEGPGENEDLQGEPFVGRAGQKLDEMIGAIGLSRAEVYIANIVKCRPPKNRDPEPDEIASCSPFLEKQIEAIRPKVIVTLGGPATKLLLATRVGITRLRGQWHGFRGIDVMPTFHPAYVLRNYTKETRMRVWEDLKAAKARAYEA